MNFPPPVRVAPQKFENYDVMVARNRYSKEHNYRPNVL